MFSFGECYKAHNLLELLLYLNGQANGMGQLNLNRTAKVAPGDLGYDGHVTGNTI
jgi:hypothetical protein